MASASARASHLGRKGGIFPTKAPSSFDAGRQLEARLIFVQADTDPG
jgi:hypothetical protein